MGKPSLHDVWQFFRRVFKSINSDLVHAAVAITENVKIALDSPIAQVISSAIDEALKTHLAEDALALLKVGAIKALAFELAIEGIPDNPTSADIERFNEDAYKAITGKDIQGQSKVWTTFASQMFITISDAVKANNGHLTFAEIVTIIENAYQQYKADVAQGN